MGQEDKILRVFEHEKVFARSEPKLTQERLKKFQEFYGSEGNPYYKLIHNGIQFTEYVGVIHVGGLTVEILPKIDKNSSKEYWHNVLIEMLKSVGLFNVHAPSTSSLQLKSNSVLDLYFELFICEVEYLLHRGLIKKYRRVEKNSLALKGPIQFSKHLQKNIIHQERFYIAQTVYDKNHKIHKILKKTIEVLKTINTNPHLMSRVGSLELNFPPVNDIFVTKELFNFSLARQDEMYSHALDISKLILLNYHPDVSNGQNNVLALMFDMNLLWEKFVLNSLQKFLRKENKIDTQSSKDFWKPNTGRGSTMRPDIIINRGKENCVVLDTKWKDVGNSNPSSNDLQQLYVYNEFFTSSKVALIYPGIKSSCKSGFYYQKQHHGISENECAVITVQANNDINEWQFNIAKQLNQWILHP